MNTERFASIIKIKKEMFDPTTREKQMDPNTTEISQEFIIPSPEQGEKQDDYIKRCMDKIAGEYDTPEQAVAVCYSQWDNKK